MGLIIIISARLWAGHKHDGFAVGMTKVGCEEEPSPYNDWDEVWDFFHAGLRRLRSEEALKPMMEECRFLLKHTDRRLNELNFLKCTDPLCAHCTTHPVQAVEAMAGFAAGVKTFYSPLKSKTHDGHFCTYKEMVAMDAAGESLPAPDQHQPSAIALDLGCCKKCPSWVFTSVTESKRHYAAFHDTTLNKVQKALAAGERIPGYAPPKTATFCKVCQKPFATRALLRQHCRDAGHMVRGRAKAAAAAAAAAGSGSESESGSEAGESSGSNVSSGDSSSSDGDSSSDSGDDDEAGSDNGEKAPVVHAEVPEGVTPCSGYTVIAGGVSTDRTRYSTSNIECEQCDKKATIKRPFEHCERCNIVYHRSCLEPQPAPSTAANPRVFLCHYNECRAEWDALMADPTLTLPNE